MPSTSMALTPGLASFLRSLKTNPIDTSIDNLISLLKRRQIRHSRSCATATAYLLLRVISACRTSDAAKLIERVQSVGRRLVAAQPKEMVVGNIVRRVLGLIRDEAEDDREADFNLSEASESQPQTPRALDDPSEYSSGRFEGSDRGSSRPPLSQPAPISMFSLLSHPEPETSLPGTPASASPSGRLLGHVQSKDVRAEVLEGVNEIIDELGQVDDQIAAYALDHIHSNEIILTHTSSTTVQKFLLKAAAKRKFTVIHAESYPNNHEATHATVSGNSTGDEEILSTESFQKPLIALGITVILIPDSAVFALMSRVNKVILGTHSVLANGGLVASAGTRVIARAAKVHQTPVVVVSGVYKLSPVYPFDFDSLIEYGDSSNVIGYEDGDLVDQIDVQNPLYDYVPAELIDLYITNLGGHAPSYLYSVLAEIEEIMEQKTGPEQKWDRILALIDFHLRNRADTAQQVKQSFISYLQSHFSSGGAQKDRLTMLTISSSSTIRDSILEAYDALGIQTLELRVLESRPLFEGASLASSILSTFKSQSKSPDKHLHITMYTDASAALAAKDADIVLLGADRISATRGVSNKTGSLPLVLSAKHVTPDVRIVVLSDMEKVNGFAGVIDDELTEGNDPFEVASAWSSDGVKGIQVLEKGVRGSKSEQENSSVTVENTYFEWVPLDMVDAFICEEGILEKDSIQEKSRKLGERADRYFGNL